MALRARLCRHGLLNIPWQPLRRDLASEAPQPVVLILVGPPGSGKSTFAEELKSRTPGRWQRINQVCVPRPGWIDPESHAAAFQHLTLGIHSFRNGYMSASGGLEICRQCAGLQDTIAGPGKKGNRQQCVRAAEKALQAGRSCLIDRCNFDADQRKDFISLACNAGCQVGNPCMFQISPLMSSFLKEQAP